MYTNDSDQRLIFPHYIYSNDTLDPLLYTLLLYQLCSGLYIFVTYV